MPPAVPQGLTGTIDTNGIVRLRWRKNTERNILGYRVLRANALDHEFTQRTNQVWRDTVFVDTVEVNTLTRFIYYRIAAVNNRYNHSATTPALGLRRPDRVPPDAPVFSDVRVSDSSVTLQWVPSSSADVRSHILYRRTQGEKRWTTLATLSATQGTYTDRAVKQNIMYEYQIEAVDSTGLSAMALLPVQARPYDSGVRRAPSALRAVYDATRKQVQLSWFYIPHKEESFYYVVYRSAPNAPLLQYNSFRAVQPAFTDANLLGPGTYTYAVKVITDSGAESPLSEKIQVTVIK
jgi:fibronectin type 3 domain-containing protein